MDKARQRLIFEIIKDMALVRRMIMTRHHSNSPEYHFPPAQTELLHLVAHCGGLSITEIAERMRVTSSAVTQQVESLVQIGFFERESDPHDRRTCRVRLSEEGTEKYEAFKNYHLEQVGRFLSPLTNEELTLIRDLHRKILAGRTVPTGKNER
ncbi:MAG: MarR family transcriptional regulator [Actinobacteria bacterium]|nr:MarR family transcriptional regulator [Actinomycetota bacterium]